MKKYKIKRQGTALKLNGAILSDSFIMYEAKDKLYILFAKKNTKGFSVYWSSGQRKEYPGAASKELCRVSTAEEVTEIIKFIEIVTDSLLISDDKSDTADKSKNIYLEEL